MSQKDTMAVLPINNIQNKMQGGGYKFTLYIYKCRYAESLRGLDSCGHF